MRCQICGKEITEGEFCEQHLAAYKNVEESYLNWRKALKIPWKEYLEKIKENKLTGVWAKEVTCYLINKEELKDVKEG
jgi:hypothetical protein